MNDDVAEVLGYLAWEVVGLVTQTALEVGNSTHTNVSLSLSFGL
jgi:hypothetical protein